MGELAEQIVNGESCEMCMMPLVGAPLGYPATCVDCGGTVEQADYEDDGEGEEDDDGDPDGKRYTGGD